MTTITYPDIAHKRPVPEKFNPNSYRVLSEKVPEYENIPFWYGHSRAPPLYTERDREPMPAQVAEQRNNPHAGRKVNVVFENATSFNAPFGIVKTDNVKNEESRWWDWSQPSGNTYGPQAKSQDEWTKIRESSYRTAYHSAGVAGPYAKKTTRYSSSPLHVKTVGIVPVTDLKPDYLESVPQDLVEKVSFEQQYNSRNKTNYPLRGKRHGAFVIEEQKPKANLTRQSDLTPSIPMEAKVTAWDLFHPQEQVRGYKTQNPYKYRRPLPQIQQREPDYGQVWQSAPFANDFQVDLFSSRLPGTKPVDME